MGEQSKINGKMVVKQQIEEEDDEEFAVISEVSVCVCDGKSEREREEGTGETKYGNWGGKKDRKKEKKLQDIED